MSQQDAPLEFLHPQHWKRAKGYANGVAGVGRLVFIAGQVGWNAEQQFESQDFVSQVRQALQNIVEILRVAGGEPAHIARLLGSSPTDENICLDCPKSAKPIAASWATTFRR